MRKKCDCCKKIFLTRRRADFCSLLCRLKSSANIKSITDCWEWHKHTIKNGYGRIGLSNRKMGLAHRVMYEQYYKVVLDKNIKVCHKCDNRKCINPNHLFLGSQRENCLDCSKKGRHADVRNENNPFCRWTDKEIENVRNLRKQGLTLLNIASITKISYSTVQKVCAYKARGEKIP